MRENRKRRLLWLLVCAGVGCSGSVSNSGGKLPTNASNHGVAGQGAAGTALASGASGAGGAHAAPSPGAVSVTSDPYDMSTAESAVRKIKNLLTGMAPSDDDVMTVAKSGAAGLQKLISTWVTDPTFQPAFHDKMLFFFRNEFQQTGFTPTEDFKLQLLENGGFDFGPFGVNAVGDDAFGRLVQNLQDSFAITAWQLISENRPFSETLTTQRFMMTTALKSLYLQIEMPNDQPFAFSRKLSSAMPLAWKVDYSGNAIPLEQTLDPSSPNYMVFDDQAPVAPSLFGMRTGSMFQSCHGGTSVDANGATVTTGTYNGYAQLFQRLLGYTPRFPFNGMPTCYEHASKPYFTTDDLTDWQWVNVRPQQAGEAYLLPYDLPTLRKTKELALKLPRVGFYTTPAFLALWNTNDSNQHRVTANQTLLVAFGSSLTSENGIVPLSTAGLDAMHATTISECYGCHKSLDPLRQFWANQFDFNDRNDFPTRGFMMTAPNPRPTALGGVLAFADVNATGTNMLDLGGMLVQATDGSDEKLTLFATTVTQKLCFYANSTACDVSDPEFRRVVKAFQSNNYGFLVLIKELFASPLVTGAQPTQSFAKDMLPVSIARRDHFCASLSNRLGKPDLCAQAVAMPSQTQAATAKIASSVTADALSRGAESPITPPDPTLFYRAATEMLCENIANQVVDVAQGAAFASTDTASAVTAISDMVEKVMGYPKSAAQHDPAIQILMDHFTAVYTQNRNNPTTALRSTFVLACESPTAVGIGL